MRPRPEDDADRTAGNARGATGGPSGEASGAGQRRRRGRGIDAIFDSTDLALDPNPVDPAIDPAVPSAAPPARSQSRADGPVDERGGGEGSVADPETNPVDPNHGARSAGANLDQEARNHGADRTYYSNPPRPDGGSGAAELPDAAAYTNAPADTYEGSEEYPSERSPRRPAGRPPANRPAGRELVQRGFYLEVEQDRTLDETKAALKRRGFTPDRSSIVRAALDHFGRLDRTDQAHLVQRAK